MKIIKKTSFSKIFNFISKEIDKNTQPTNAVKSEKIILKYKDGKKNLNRKSNMANTYSEIAMQINTKMVEWCRAKIKNGGIYNDCT